MKYVICLFRKTFRGGSYSEYIMVEKPKDNNYDYIMSDWGESSSGGAEDGYTVYLDEIIFDPTKELIEHVSKVIKKDISYSLKHIKYLKSKLNSLSKMKVGELPKESKVLYDKIKTCRLFKHFNCDTKIGEIIFEDGSIIDEKDLEFLLKKKYLKTSHIVINDNIITHEYIIEI